MRNKRMIFGMVVVLLLLTAVTSFAQNEATGVDSAFHVSQKTTIVEASTGQKNPLVQQASIAEGEPPVPVDILSITVDRTGDEANELFLVIEWMSRNCLEASFETQFANNVISVQAVSPAQEENLVCDAPAFGEEDIFLGDTFESDESYAIVVNDFFGEIYLPRPGGTLLDHPTQLAPVGSTLLAPLVPVFSSLEALSLELPEAAGDDVEAAQSLIVEVVGIHPDGCDVLPYVRMVPDLVDETLHVVEVFRFLSPTIPCTSQVLPFTLIFESPVDPQEVQFVRADERLYEWMPEESELIEMAEGATDMPDETDGNLRRVETVIESVDVAVLESFPMQLSLTVSGYQPDGCDVPVQVEQEVNENTVVISIYRELPIDVMCPASIVPYEETIMVNAGFEGGTVEIRVNDFTTSVDL